MKNSVYNYKLISKIDFRVFYIKSIGSGYEITRIDSNFYEAGTDIALRNIPHYEIWVTEDYLMDKLKIDHSPTDQEYADFAYKFIEKRFNANLFNGSRVIPSEFGAFISKSKEKLVKNRAELYEIAQIKL